MQKDASKEGAASADVAVQAFASTPANPQGAAADLTAASAAAGRERRRAEPHRASRGHGEDERRRGQAAGAATAGPHRRSAPTHGGPHRAGPRQAAAAGPLRRCRAPPRGGLGGADQATAWADLGPHGVDPAADHRKVPPPPWTRPSARSARGEEGEEVRGRSPAAVFLAAAWTSSGCSGDGEGWGAARGVGAAAGVWSARAAPRRTTWASASSDIATYCH